MTFNVVSCNGVFMPKVQEPITTLRLTSEWFPFEGYHRTVAEVNNFDTVNIDKFPKVESVTRVNATFPRENSHLPW